jgi:hypothetical protein
MNRQDVTYQDKLNELRLDILHPNSFGVNFILVEGDSDIKLFRKLFDIEKCKIENIPGGKNKLEECVNTLINTYPLIIGIRDTDFLNLNNINYTKHNMFLTDKHDIETTMISDEDVLNTLVFEFTNTPKNQHISLLNNITTSIEMVGYLKWLNSIENLELKFGCGFQDLVSFNNFNINFDTYFSRVLLKSPNAKIIDINLIKSKITELKATNPENFLLTNGHDLVNTLANYIKNVSGIKGVSNENIASILRISFNHKQLEKTNLYTELNNWSNNNNTKIFKE